MDGGRRDEDGDGKGRAGSGGWWGRVGMGWEVAADGTCLGL